MKALPKAVWWTFNGLPYGTQQHSHDVLQANFITMDKVHWNRFKIELHGVLHNLWYEFGQPVVMYSGGADSEMIIREFLALGKTPEVHCIKFTDRSNGPDIAQARELAKELDINIYFHEHDVEAFLNSGQHKELGVKFGTSDLSLITAYKYAQHLGKPIILGPELIMQKHQRPGPVDAVDDWYLIVGEHSFSAVQFELKTGTPCFGELFYHSSELLMSLLDLPEMREAMRAPGKISLAYQKNAILEKALGYKFTAVKKRHGYEPIYQTFRRGVNEVKQSLPYIQQEARILVQDAKYQLIRQDI